MMTTNPFSRLTNDEISNNLEDIFQVTLNEQGASRYYYMKDIQRMLRSNHLNVDNLAEVLFERILEQNESFQESVIRYLFECFERTLVYENKNILDTNRICDIILQNTLVCILQPELLNSSNVHDQFFQLIRSNHTSQSFQRFFLSVCQKFLEDRDNDWAFNEFLRQVFKKISTKIIEENRIFVDKYVFDFLSWFASTDILAERFWNIMTPSEDRITGRMFLNSILGCLLNNSVIKDRSSQQISEFFDSPFEERSVNATQEGIWYKNNELINELHKLFMSFIRMNEKIRNKALNWISKCIKANEAKSKIWNSLLVQGGFMEADNVSDGFMANLLQILLKMCQPFCNDLNILKVLKVDPTYCILSEKEIKDKSLHYCFANETCLLPLNLNNQQNIVQKPSADTFNFITECFFITHKTIQCSFNVILSILSALNAEIAKLENYFNETSSAVNRRNEYLEPLRYQLTLVLKKYLTFKSIMINPAFINDLSNFFAASAFWLCQVAFNNEIDINSKCFAPLIQRVINFPIEHEAPISLCCVPEIIVDNIVGFFVFLRRFSSQTFEDLGFFLLDPVLTMILIFMGSSEFMRNPHLRARLAECLSMLLPASKETTSVRQETEIYFQREKLFLEHPFRLHIVKSLLEVFVSIEVTGQSVDFEQKFNYRRPMYQIMEFLWEKPIHNQCFIKLAEEAEKKMLNVQPPLFLRFVNLLMNDAVFLLDEALSNMSRIRTLELEQDAGRWIQLSEEENQENVENLRRIGLLAKFDNLLGKDTIYTLVLLTSKIRAIFTHPTMVDRIASTLNFFLLNLVGPNKRNFKVKDSSLYNFNPAEMVLNICKIYMHLKDSDGFCLAISQDGRSYTPQLFSYAEDVLCRITGGGFYVNEMEQLNDRVLRLAKKKKREEEILVDVPDEFLDPIMSTMMTDPVMLPSSKVIVDRNTIARHFLSDQTDPFNRSVLTMDQLIPQDDLKRKIANWIQEKEAAFPESSSY